jgi:hypothetical protein
MFRPLKNSVNTKNPEICWCRKFSSSTENNVKMNNSRKLFLLRTSGTGTEPEAFLEISRLRAFDFYLHLHDCSQLRKFTVDLGCWVVRLYHREFESVAI